VPDASVLIRSAEYNQPILIDQGTADPFLAEQLLPDVFEQACATVGQPLTLASNEGYNHSYYFIATWSKITSATTPPLCADSPELISLSANTSPYANVAQ